MCTRKQANIELNPDSNTLVRPSPFRRAVAWLTLIAYVGQPLVVTAEVIADQAAAANRRPVVDVTANGLPLVQITTPSAAGVSHNQYTQFNVGPAGVILNNSQTTVQTQQAGFVSANPNLVNGSARIILNEVTSTSRSQLNGYTEVAGQQAEVIIANPNGITCNGCGFINTSRGVLTTGTPMIGVGGSLDYFRVTSGDIQIGSAGMSGNNLSQLDLIARSVQVNGELWANNLNVIAGTNEVNYNLQGITVITDVPGKPTVGIDVALLGGMYANKIRLIGTEAGVGVNSLGNLSAQAGDFYLDNAGQITLGGNTTASGNTTTSGNITIKSNTDITNNGLLYSQQATQLTSTGGEISNTGLLSAGSNLTLNANTLSSTGALGAGIDVNGAAMQSGDLNITTQNQTVISGVNMTGGSMSIIANAGDINLANSKTNAWRGVSLTATTGNIDLTRARTQSVLGNIDLTASGVVNNTAGYIYGANITSNSAGFINTNIGLDKGMVGADGNITLNANSIDNTNGQIGNALYGLGNITLGLGTTGILTNTSGLIDSDQNLSIIANTITGNGQAIAGWDADIKLQGNYTNAAGNVFKANNNLTFNTTGNFFNQTGLKAAGTLSVTAANIDNSGRFEGYTVETHSNNFTNTATVMADVINIYANNLDNSSTNAVIGATQSINLIIANALNNQDGGYILSLGDINIGSNLAINPATGYLVGNAVSVTNQSATIEAWGNMRISADTITNKRTLLTIGTSSWTGTPVIGSAQHNGVGGTPSITSTFTEEYVSASTPEASLKVSGNAWFKANAINNEYSTVAIGGTEKFSANIINTAKVLDRVETQTQTQDNLVTVQTGTQLGTCHKTVMGVSVPYGCMKPVYSDVNYPTTSTQTNTTHVGYVNATHTATVLQGSAGSVNNQTISSGTVGGTASTLGAVLGSTQGSVTASNGTNTVTVPSSGLYTLHPQPGQNYLVATDPRFTSYQNYVSSDYMLSRMSLDPMMMEKRLGDGFYEQKLILDQITELTGRRFLGKNASANEQYTALLDAGVEAAKELKLVPGLTLTAEQVGALTHDIVWLVDQVAKLPDGTTQHVLAPKVYLTRLHEADLKPSGALIAADVIDIKITEKTLVAKGPDELGRITEGTGFRMPILNESKVWVKEGIVAIDDGAVQPMRDLNSQSFRINDSAALSKPINKIVAGGADERIQIELRDNAAPVYLESAIANKIVYESTPRLTSGAFNNSGTIRANTSLSIDALDIINRGGTISSGGSLNLNARNDILNQSGNISGRRVALTAGRDIISERLTDNIVRGSLNQMQSNLFGKVALTTAPQAGFTTTLIHGAAGITATDSLDISAGRDVTIAGSNVNAGGDATISAGRNLTVRTVTAQETTNNGVVSTNRIEQLTSSIKTGGNLTLASVNDMHLTSVALDVGKDASLAAGGDLTLDASKNVSSINIDTEVTKVRRYDETVLGTTLNAGGNVTLAATRVKTDDAENNQNETISSNVDSDASNTGSDPAEPGDVPPAGRADKKGNIKLVGTTINSKGTVAIVADSNVEITTVDEKHENFKQSSTKSAGLMSSTTTTRTTENSSSTAIGSNISGANIVLQAGDQATKIGNITIQGSNLAATEVVSIDAGNDLKILSAEDSASSSSSVEVARSGFSMGSSGVEFGKRNSTTVTDGSTTQVASNISGKTVITQSGNDTRIRASNIQSTEDTTLYSGGSMYIESAANTTRHNQETTESKIGLNVAMMDGRLHDISVGRNSKITEDGNTSSTQVGSQIGSLGNLNILSSNSILISASKLKSGKDMNLTAGGDVIITGQYNEAATDKSVANRMSSMKSKNKTGDQTQDYTFVGSTLDAGNNLNIKAGNDVDLTAANLSSGADTNLTAEGGQVRFLSQKNIKVVSHTFDNEDLVYEVHKGKGTKDETTVYTQIKTGGKLNVDAAKGVVVEVEEVPVTPVAEETADGADGTAPAAPHVAANDPNFIPHPTFTASTAALAKQPGMEWMDQMLKRKDVDWKKVSAAHDSWDYKNQNLTEAGAVILVVVVTFFTAGTASSATAAVTTASGSAAVGAAAGAAVTSLATTAALSFANNGGDLGKTLNDLGKSENVRGLLTAMVTAGVLKGLEGTQIVSSISNATSLPVNLVNNTINSALTATVNTAINGGSLKDQLGSALISAMVNTAGAELAGDLHTDDKGLIANLNNKLGHALLGCGMEAAQNRSCISGAVGGVAGEIAGELLAPNGSKGLTDAQKFKIINLSKLIAGGVAMAAGLDVSAAMATAGNAVANNRLMTPKEKSLIAEMAKLAEGDPDKEARLSDAACAKIHCSAQFPVGSQERQYYEGVETRGQGNTYELQQLTELQKTDPSLFSYGWVDTGVDAGKKVGNTTLRAAGKVGDFGEGFAIGMGNAVVQTGAMVVDGAQMLSAGSEEHAFSGNTDQALEDITPVSNLGKAIKQDGVIETVINAPGNAARGFSGTMLALGQGNLEPFGELAGGMAVPVVTGSLVGRLLAEPNYVTVYRVEGIPNQRLSIDGVGNVSIIPGNNNTIWLNFGEADRAIDYFSRKVSQDLPGAQLKSFEVEPTFLQQIQNSAVPEQFARRFPNNPIISADPFPNQFGIRQTQFQQLLDSIQQGTGKNGH